MEKVIVEADDRWGAVVRATEAWGVLGMQRMQVFFDACSVHKVARRNEKEVYEVDDVSKHKGTAESIVVDRVASIVGRSKALAEDGWELIVMSLRDIGSDVVARDVVKDLREAYGCSDCADYVEENYWGPDEQT
jgi:hypothetical protein